MTTNDRISLITALQHYHETGRITDGDYQRILAALEQLLSSADL